MGIPRSWSTYIANGFVYIPKHIRTQNSNYALERGKVDNFEFVSAMPSSLEGVALDFGNRLKIDFSLLEILGNDKIIILGDSSMFRIWNEAVFNDYNSKIDIMKEIEAINFYLGKSAEAVVIL